MSMYAAGGFLSAHTLMEAAGWPDYHGDLLHLALELGDRLLPAFNTASGIPLSWINLAKVRGKGMRIMHDCA